MFCWEGPFTIQFLGVVCLGFRAHCVGFRDVLLQHSVERVVHHMLHRFSFSWFIVGSVCAAF